jgi:molybdopterin-guanine dinucleotide biosynthesis protein A
VTGRVGGILLTGGASRRLGTDKATLLLDGETLAARAARLLATVCDPVVEVGPGRSPLRSVVEEPPGGGPLAALVAGWDALCPVDAVVLLAVDMPGIGAPLVQRLVEWPGRATAVPFAGGRLQPVCARFGADAVATARGLLSSGGRSMRALLGAVPHDVLGPDEWADVATDPDFADVDTPEDAHRFGLQVPGTLAG